MTGTNGSRRRGGGSTQDDLRERLPELMLRDAHRLGRRLESARGIRDQSARAERIAALTAEVDTAWLRVEARRESMPAITYPPDLPISQKRDDIAAAIRDHQVVVVAGETGSGKTTQLPKICLELGRGVRGLIGHTQPRRIAARTVADRIAEELGTELGDTIGYTIRFTDRVSETTLVKLMTDGILLAEIQRDRLLLGYDTLIIDEAHERSLNVDFLLGYLRRLLPQRPDLKVVITSATIDPHRFAAHFRTPAGPAPVIEVSGRTYAVEMRYRPMVPDVGDDEIARPGEAEADPHDQAAAICDAVEELCAEGRGDVLVFLSGEREIRDTADALRGRLRLGGPDAPSVEILPLYARLSNAEQHRVFAPHHGRRIVLATNVAETSLTVPGITYVVDPGTARMSRYSMRLKVQRLPIEAVSQASADQRAGRCGRVSAGICIRLYSEEDYASRPEFTEPEILRTNLASVILQMTALGLGDVARFPFLDPPDRRNIADGIALLEELGALDPAAPDPEKRLTPVGVKLAALPVDPRIARMILEADRYGCLREVVIIAAALSIQDPRERPVEKQEAARAKHARFADPDSDFVSYLNLWTYLREQQGELSSSAFRRMCTRDFLHYLRVREWQDLVAQLREVAGGLGLKWNSSPSDPHHVHLALLAGLLTHIGMKDPEKGDFLGARGARFAVFPGSALFKKTPKWVMAAELVETSRLWARTVARIEPEWVEPLAEHLVKRTYSEPHWERKRGAVVAYERVTLYGVPLVAGRRSDYARIDPELCRELFIRNALVEGDWDTHHRFFHDNQALREEVEDLEHRARRRDILVDDETLFDFYDKRLPSDVVSAAHFDGWWKKARRNRPDLLAFDTDLLISADAAAVHADDYPDSWTQGDLSLDLTYQFEPGADADGVTVHIPLAVLNRVRVEGFDWQIPGLRAELATALIRSLPKAVRRNFVPAPDHAAEALRRLTPLDGTFIGALGHALGERVGVRIDADDWDLERVPPHLRMTFRVEDDTGRTAGEGKDLAALMERLAPKVRAVMAAGAAEVERTGLTAWPGADTIPSGAVPRTYTQTRDGQVVQGFPALVDAGETVALRVLGTPAEQAAAMWAGTRRLLLLGVNSPVKAVLARLDNRAKLALSAAPHASGTALFADCLDAAVDALIAENGGPAWDAAAHARLAAAVRENLHARLTAVVADVVTVLTVAQDVDARLARSDSLAVLASLTDMREHYRALLYPGFVTATGAARLPDVARYLRGIGRRLDKLAESPDRDRTRLAQVAQLEREYAALVAGLPPARRTEPAVVEIRWMLQELRVSLFAQTLGTAYPISEKRILRAMDEAEHPLRP
jgi:ATP-dependent helicase HrpA